MSIKLYGRLALPLFILWHVLSASLSRPGILQVKLNKHLQQMMPSSVKMFFCLQRFTDYTAVLPAGSSTNNFMVITPAYKSMQTVLHLIKSANAKASENCSSDDFSGSAW